MGLANVLSDLEKFIKKGQLPGRGQEFDRADRMQREDDARARKIRRAPAPRPKTQDPRFYRRPR
mgnify:FL=1